MQLTTPISGSPEPDNELEEVTDNSNSGNGVSGFPSQLSFSALGLPATASVRAIWLAPLHYRALQRMVISIAPLDQSLASRASKFTYMLNFTQAAKDNLNWWVSLDRHLLTDSLIHPRILGMITESDASNTGWGARQGEMQTGGRWSTSEVSNHINYLELLAANLALQCFAKQKHNTTILLKMDNVTAVMWGTQSEGLCQLALTIWNWCLHQNIFLIAEYLPVEENTVADEESRNMKNRCDWMLNPLIFRQV